MASTVRRLVPLLGKANQHLMSVLQQRLHVMLRIKVSAASAREHNGRADPDRQTDGRAGEGRLRAVSHLLTASNHSAWNSATV